MSKSKRYKKKTSPKDIHKDLVKSIKMHAGRLDTPAPIIFKDKKKYSRKEKHRGIYPIDRNSGFFMPAA